MKIGIIGLGKMGFGAAKHLSEDGFEVVAVDTKKEIIEKAQSEGIDSFLSIEKMLDKLSKPKIILLMVPAGSPVNNCIEQLIPELSAGDIIADTGNSFYKDSIKRAELLNEKGILFLDVGTSGGIKISKGKACMMVGGNKETYALLEPVFNSLCVKNGCRYIGKNGAGHLVKGYHNFVEYITMEGIAEGSEAIKKVSESEGIDINLKEVFDLWNHGSINEGMLIESAKKAVEKYGNLEDVDGRVFGETTEEMNSLADIAELKGVDVSAGRAAILKRKESQKNPTYSTKLLNAMRSSFGGHLPGKPVKKNDN